VPGRNHLSFTVATLAVVLSWTAPAHSQGTRQYGEGDELKFSDPQMREAIENEKKYRATINKIPNQKQDPWGNVRAPQQQQQPATANQRRQN
jgi:hypothetical protein